MLMIGMMFEPAGDRALLREAARELVWRYLFVAASAALVFFCTPFELVCAADAVHRLLCAAVVPCADLHRPLPQRHGAGEFHELGFHRGEPDCHAGSGGLGLCCKGREEDVWEGFVLGLCPHQEPEVLGFPLSWIAAQSMLLQIEMQARSEEEGQGT